MWGRKESKNQETSKKVNVGQAQMLELSEDSRENPGSPYHLFASLVFVSGDILVNHRIYEYHGQIDIRTE